MGNCLRPSTYVMGSNVNLGSFGVEKRERFVSFQQHNGSSFWFPPPPISVLGFLGMVSIPLPPLFSWLFPSIVFYSTEISLGSNCYGRSALLYFAIFIKHCYMYMILSWLRLGSGGPCLYVFFFFPTPPNQSTGK